MNYTDVTPGTVYAAVSARPEDGAEALQTSYGSAQRPLVPVTESIPVATIGTPTVAGRAPLPTVLIETDAVGRDGCGADTWVGGWAANAAWHRSA